MPRHRMPRDALVHSGLHKTGSQCRLHQRVAWHAMPRNGTSLRARLAPFFGKANRVHCRMPIWRCNTSGDPRHRPEGTHTIDPRGPTPSTRGVPRHRPEGFHTIDPRGPTPSTRGDPHHRPEGSHTIERDPTPRDPTPRDPNPRVPTPRGPTPRDPFHEAPPRETPPILPSYLLPSYHPTILPRLPRTTAAHAPSHVTASSQSRAAAYKFVA